MVTWLVRLIAIATVNVISLVARLLLMLCLHAGRYLSPPFFRLAVLGTGRLLSVLDRHVQGRIATSTVAMLLVSGVMWALIGVLVIVLMSLAISFWPSCLNTPIVAGGFLFGLVCGLRIRMEPAWGIVADEDGILLGENLRW